MKYQEIIAIDPDCELSGVACVDTRNGEVEVFTKSNPAATVNSTATRFSSSVK